MKNIINRLVMELRALLQWWVGEFLDIAVRLQAVIAPRRTQSVVVRCEPNRCLVWVTSGKARSEEVAIERNESGEWPDSPLGDELNHIRKMRTTLLIPETDALVHMVRVPVAAERNLAAVVSLAMERELPLAPDQLATDWCIVSRNASWLLVRITAIQKSRLQLLHSLAERWGLHIARSAIVASDFDGVDLRRIHGNLTERRRVRISTPWSTTQKRLAMAASAAVVLAVILTAGQWIYERARIAGSLREARESSSQLASLKERFERDAGPVVDLSRLLRKEDALGVLARLTQAVSADSWAHEVKIQEDAAGGFAVELTGRTPSGAALTQQLAEAAGLKEVKLVSSPPAEFGEQKGRFNITLKWIDPS